MMSIALMAASSSYDIQVFAKPQFHKLRGVSYPGVIYLSFPKEIHIEFKTHLEAL